jgi:hypothetical protein
MWPWRTSTFLRWPEPDGFMGAGAGQWRRHVTTSVSLWGVKRFCSPAGATATDFVTDDEAALKWTMLSAAALAMAPRSGGLRGPVDETMVIAAIDRGE